MTTLAIIQNARTSHHKVAVRGVAPGYTDAPVILEPGSSHSAHVWDGLHLEVTEIPLEKQE